jgi:hypothetical protein
MTRTTPPRRHADPDRPMPDPQMPRGKDGEPHYTTWLVIRYQGGDTGGRPLAPGAVFWESPDVWTQGSQGTNQPVVNEPTQVFARVTNLGMQDATGVTIKYWWADPSVAIVEDPTKLIGEITNAAIPSNNSLVFQCPTDWIPIEVNNGHECLVAEAYIPVFDGLTDPMHPVGDRHVGQKNEQLITLQPGQQLHFPVLAHNFARTEQQVTVEVHPGLLPRDFARRFGRPGMWSHPLFDPIRPMAVELHVERRRLRLAEPSERAAARLTHAGRQGGASCLGAPLTRSTASFQPHEVRRVTLSGALPPSAQPGEVYAMRIIQRIGDVVAGGYTLYVTRAVSRR